MRASSSLSRSFTTTQSWLVEVCLAVLIFTADTFSLRSNCSTSTSSCRMTRRRTTLLSTCKHILLSASWDCRADRRRPNAGPHSPNSTCTHRCRSLTRGCTTRFYALSWISTSYRCSRAS